MFDKFLLVLIVVLGVGGALAIGKALREDRDERWEAFRVENECRVVERVPSSVVPVIGTGVGPNGQVVTTFGVGTTPARTAWLCKDGVTYWR